MFDFFKSLLFDLLHKIQVPNKDDRSECLLDFFDEHFGDSLFEDLSLQDDLPFVADGGESSRAVGSAEPTHPKRFVSGHPTLLHQFNETDYFLKAFGELSRKIFQSDRDFGEEGIVISLLEQRRVLGVDWLKLIALKYWVLKLGCRLAAEGPANRQAADLSFFYAMTSHHFTSQIYDGYGVTVRVRECDLTNPDKLTQKTHQNEEAQIAILSQVIYSKEK
jgi:hypothetical protein